MRQTIRYTMAPDGIRIAYAISGRGAPLVRAPTWLNHLEHDCEGPTLRHWLAELSTRHLLVRYDARGCGLSERNVSDFGFDALVRDLEAVVDGAKLQRFALTGNSLGAAVAIAYAARHPDRVDRMFLVGSFCRGRLRRGAGPAEAEKAAMLLKLIERGWGSEDEAFLQVFTAQFMPGGTAEHWHWFSEHMRLATSAANAVALSRTVQQLDVQDAARNVRCPTLVLHARQDRVVPYEEGQRTAALIPGAEFVTLEGAGHIVLPEEAAWETVVAELRRFLPGPIAAPEEFGLSPREHQVLDLMARGCSNDEIAVRLGLTAKTVRNCGSRIYAKLGVTTRARAIVVAREAGIGTAATGSHAA